MKKLQNHIFLQIKPLKNSSQHSSTHNYIRLFGDLWFNISQNPHSLYFTPFSYFHQITHVEIQNSSLIIHFQSKQSQIHLQQNQKIIAKHNPTYSQFLMEIIKSTDKFEKCSQYQKNKLNISLNKLQKKKQINLQNLNKIIKQQICLVLDGNFSISNFFFTVQRLLISQKLIRLLGRDPKKQTLKILQQQRVDEFFSSDGYVQLMIKLIKFFKYLQAIFVEKQQFIEIEDMTIYQGVQYLLKSEQMRIKCNVKVTYKHPSMLLMYIYPDLNETIQIGNSCCGKVQKGEDENEKLKRKILKYDKFGENNRIATYRQWNVKKDKSIQIISKEQR